MVRHGHPTKEMGREDESPRPWSVPTRNETLVEVAKHDAEHRVGRAVDRVGVADSVLDVVAEGRGRPGEILQGHAARKVVGADAPVAAGTRTPPIAVVTGAACWFTTFVGPSVTT